MNITHCSVIVPTFGYPSPLASPIAPTSWKTGRNHFPISTLLHLGSILDTTAFRFIARYEFSLTAEGPACRAHLRDRRTYRGANTTSGGLSTNFSDQNKWTTISSALS